MNLFENDKNQRRTPVLSGLVSDLFGEIQPMSTRSPPRSASSLALRALRSQRFDSASHPRRTRAASSMTSGPRICSQRSAQKAVLDYRTLGLSGILWEPHLDVPHHSPPVANYTICAGSLYRCEQLPRRGEENRTADPAGKDLSGLLRPDGSRMRTVPWTFATGIMSAARRD